MKNEFDEWKEIAKTFDGDTALFWAGRMSTVVKLILMGSIHQVSEQFKLLDKCRMEYDRIIFNRTEAR